ncbi:MFS transporter [Kibdelosporangium phytohabitans]|uniref:MFS transporter n=1 Tax=Kibdelosporangium phytohabitans TaxID=860235 RepID=A0A0N9I3J2_9PSEU|nr:MFS transporter [Kibdelosporangium phytohabitans]ALG10483.1 MFS transporter [Kibdelosporangium phytohabitans]MBE1461568.1 DHA2 family multidrug resistance protein-like MFS transporter [Kibdelosporangium phytohabitans]
MSTTYNTRPSQTSAGRRWAALAVLSASLLVIAMDMTILNVALPRITEDLAPTAAQQLWIVDVYSLIIAGLLVPVSALADRFGRKRVLLAGYLAFGTASLAILLVDTPGGVIAVRALLGAAGAMIMPTTLSMLRVVFTDPKERATALGVWASVSAVGMAVGPVVGGLLLEHVSWQSAFLVNVPLMVLALVAGLFLLPEYRTPTPPRWDTAGTVASIVGMVALVWSIKHFADKGFGDAVSWAAFTAAVVFLGWFVRRCLRRPDPMLDLKLFRRPPFTAGIVAALASMFALGALMLLVAQWLQFVDGRSPLQAGLALLPAAVAMGIASPLAPALAGRIGARNVLSGGLAIAALGFLVIYLAPSPLGYSWIAVALVLLGGGGSALAVGSAIIMSDTPQEKAGNAAALEETSYELGSVLGVAILGSVAASAYASELDGALTGMDPGQAEAARESLGGALGIATQNGSSDLAAHATAAFVDSLTFTGLVGSLTMLAAAVVAFLLVPRTLQITKQSH